MALARLVNLRDPPQIVITPADDRLPVATRAPDLELPRLHPKIAFMRRVVELEIRLSYHDRIKGTLPEAMQDPSAGILAEDSEAPYYPFENPGECACFKIRCKQ